MIQPRKLLNETEGPSAAFVPAPSRQAEPGSRDPRIEAYLDRLVDRLPGGVPEFKVHDLRVEVGEHLEALVEAHAELGLEGQDPVEAAIRQFGRPERVAREWSKAWKRASGQSSTAGLVLSLPVFLWSLLFFGLGMPAVLAELFDLHGLHAFLAGPAIPMTAGVWWALRGERRYLPLVLLLVSGGLLQAALTPAELTRDVTDTTRDLIIPGSTLTTLWIAAMLCVWALVACGAAGTTACIRKLWERWGRPAPA